VKRSITSSTAWKTPEYFHRSMNRRISRQVLDCGDGVCGVTALAVAALKIAKRAADTATPTQSGDFDDSVAALQDAGALAAAPFRFMAPVRVQSWRLKLSMNRSVLPASCRQKKLGSADETSAARCRAASTLRRFMVPMRAQNEWRLPMNGPNVPPGLGVRQSSAALRIGRAGESGRGLPHSKTLTRWREPLSASWFHCAVARSFRALMNLWPRSAKHCFARCAQAEQCRCFSNLSGRCWLLFFWPGVERRRPCLR